MKLFSPAYLAHLRQPLTTLAVCWRIEKRDGSVILGTTHDADILITQTNVGVDTGSPGLDLTGVYSASAGITASDIRSGSDMSVDNMEVQGVTATPDLYVDVSVADMEAGLLDAARVITFLVNWQDPDDFQDVKRYGFLGELPRTAEGEYRAEVRGLTQVLQQSIGRNCGERCDVEEFGDARCKKDVEAITVTATITAVNSRRDFEVSIPLDSPPQQSGYYNLGKVVMLDGENAGYTRQVRNDSVDGILGRLELWEPFPLDLEVGQTMRLSPGCDRLYTTCRDVHENLLNFRGPGFFTPGMDEIVRAP